MKKPRPTPHRGHAYCIADGICVPQQLHDDFVAQLGARISEFDLLDWYLKRTRERRIEQIVVEDIWTQWRGEFRAELRARGWTEPRQPQPQSAADIKRFQANRAIGGSRSCQHEPKCSTFAQCTALLIAEGRQSRADSMAHITEAKPDTRGDLKRFAERWSPHNS